MSVRSVSISRLTQLLWVPPNELAIWNG